MGFRPLVIVRVVLLLAALGVVPVVRAELRPSSIAKIKNVFVPHGFDDNDEVVVVVEGYLPDTCFKLAEVEVISKDDEITVVQRMREYSGTCFDVTVPFTQVIKVGTLKSGNYQVKVIGGADRTPLYVKPATKLGPDDYFYASVESARVDRLTATLRMRLTNSCLRIEKYEKNHTGRTVQLLPIMRLQSASEAGHPCVEQDELFEEIVDLKSLALEPGRHLLHVRSLEGQSVNVVFGKN